MKYLLCIFLVLVCLHTVLAQHIVGLGIGRMLNNKKIYEYRSYASADLHYGYARGLFMIKTGIDLVPFTEFGLKYCGYGAIGVTSEINSPFSFHTLLGLAGIRSTKSHYNSEKYGARLSINDSGSLFANLGRLYELKGIEGLSLLGLDLIVWPEYITHYTGGHGPGSYYYTTNFPVTLVLSLNKKF